MNPNVALSITCVATGRTGGNALARMFIHECSAVHSSGICHTLAIENRVATPSNAGCRSKQMPLRRTKEQDMPNADDVVTNQSSAGDTIPSACTVIEVHVAELKQLFNAIDPLPFREKDLGPTSDLQMASRRADQAQFITLSAIRTERFELMRRLAALPDD